MINDRVIVQTNNKDVSLVFVDNLPSLEEMFLTLPNHIIKTSLNTLEEDLRDLDINTLLLLHSVLDEHQNGFKTYKKDPKLYLKFQILGAKIENLINVKDKSSALSNDSRDIWNNLLLKSFKQFNKVAIDFIKG